MNHVHTYVHILMSSTTGAHQLCLLLDFFLNPRQNYSIKVNHLKMLMFINRRFQTLNTIDCWFNLLSTTKFIIKTVNFLAI